MSVALVAPGRIMFHEPKESALWHPLRASLPPSEGGGSASMMTPNAIPGLSGWWDASSYANFADAKSVSLAGWGLPADHIMDLSGNQRLLTPYHFATAGTNQPIAAPRISGLLGGYGYDLGTGPYYPTLDYDLGFQVANVPMGNAASWTRLFVWSRPNWKQNPYSADPTPNPLIYSGTTPVLTVDGSGGSGQLMLFPGTPNATVISSSITRRHTHAVIIRYSTGLGTDVWLDGVPAVAGISNPLSGGPTVPLLLLHSGNGYTTGGGQCWFHELATWERALTDQEMTTLGAYAHRWALGPRKCVSLMFNGQSNARNAIESANADLTLARGLAWYLGAIAYGRASKTQNGGPGTVVPGMGIYVYPETANPLYAGTFLNDPLDGSDPSTWTLGAMGQEVQAWVQSLPSEDLDDIAALVIWWNETDSFRSYDDKGRFASAARRWITLFRSMFNGSTTQSLPVVWWNAIPFGNTDGIQMHREVVGSLCADPVLNVVMGNPMTADSNNLDDGTLAYDATTGIQTGGDSQHRNLTDLTIFARRATPVVARALLHAGRGDAVSSIPAGLPTVGGPWMTHVYRENDASLVVTVRHDAGNDLRVPLQAANGAGFLVMDGGSVASPGILVPAIACARVDPTHLRITLAQPLQNSSSNCLLFYPYGSYTPARAPGYTANMGRGNSVTDNFSAVAKPGGWDIGTDLGSAWSIDFPLAATTVPIVLSDDPA